jgi:hypothetical protein
LGLGLSLDLDLGLSLSLGFRLRLRPRFKPKPKPRLKPMLYITFFFIILKKSIIISGKPIRIPSSLDLAAADENEPINPEEKTVKLRAEGAIPVLPPGLMQEAKEAAERRARTVTPTSFVKIPQEVTQNVVTQLPPSNDEPDSARYVFQTRKYSMPEYVRREVFPERSIPREPPKENQERSIPREVHLERNIQAIESVPRWQNASPAPYLLGRPVFTPVDEVERIRDKFNRKTESRASSVAFSREPSIPAHMTSSYHADYNREKTASPIITFRYVNKIGGSPT